MQKAPTTFHGSELRLAQPRPLSSRSSKRNPPSLSSKDAVKTKLRSTPPVSAKAPRQSAPVDELPCPYCPKKDCKGKLGLSVHLARWCLCNPNGAAWVPPKPSGSRKVPTGSGALKTPRQLTPVLPGQGYRQAPPIGLRTPTVPRRDPTVSQSSAVARPIARDSRRGSKVASKKASPAPSTEALPKSASNTRISHRTVVSKSGRGGVRQG